MSSDETELLKELTKKKLKEAFHKECVHAYLKSPGSTAITQTALKQLQKVINETS